MSSETRELTVRQFFARGGVLAQCHPSYEFRSGQLEMAEAVESALADRRHLIVEAGTGTGKTLAYLVPALVSGKRIVISTATKNLQEQLLFKDIPFLQKYLGRQVRVCYMKGRNNYACRQKIYDAEKEPVLEGLEEVADFEIIRDWEKTTATGLSVAGYERSLVACRRRLGRPQAAPAAILAPCRPKKSDPHCRMLGSQPTKPRGAFPVHLSFGKLSILVVMHGDDHPGAVGNRSFTFTAPTELPSTPGRSERRTAEVPWTRSLRSRTKPNVGNEIQAGLGFCIADHHIPVLEHPPKTTR
jgi:hypothetical protein